MIIQYPIKPYFDEADATRRCIIQDKPLLGSYAAHGHDYIEMELILAGYGKLWINNTFMELAPGILYLLTPDDYHRLEVIVPGRVISIHLSTESLAYVGLSSQQAAYVQHLTHDQLLAYDKRLSGLANDEREKRPYFEQDLYAFAIQMMIDLLRNGSSYTLTQPARRLHRALKYVQEHYTDQNLRLEDVARSCELSRNYFSAVFTQTVGCHFADYVLECRLQHACALLGSTTLPITDIAYEVGFSTLSHFFRSFKKAFMCTPAQYRKGASLTSMK